MVDFVGRRRELAVLSRTLAAVDAAKHSARRMAFLRLPQ